MTKSDILPAWGRLLRGYRPLLSIEITKECPLRCPGCYAYGDQHIDMGGEVTLRQLSDHRGNQLVDGVLALVRRFRPIHLSLVGGEPLVRWRELDVLLPKLDKMGVEVQLVTSAVRALPAHWAKIGSLHIAVSVDGLAPEHDVRRAPATYVRILQHIQDHRVIIHCTVTRQMLARDGYLMDFAEFWSQRDAARKIWFSLYTPQEGEISEERLTPRDRHRALEQLAQVAQRYPKVELPRAVLEGYRQPPASPEECIFAQSAHCFSADLATPIAPCQFGGKPACSECGCMASAGLTAIGRHRLGGLLPISALVTASHRIGALMPAPRP